VRIAAAVAASNGPYHEPSFFLMGTNNDAPLHKLLFKIDCLNAELNLLRTLSPQMRIALDYPRQRVRQIERQIARLSERRQRTLQHQHFSAASLLGSRWPLIIIPPLNVSEMSRRENFLPAVVIRRLLCCRQQASFVRRLRWVSVVHEGIRIIITTEAYTSRTCSICFTIRGPFSDELFYCANDQCPAHTCPMLRDLNAAIMIALRSQGRLTVWDALSIVQLVL